MRVKVLYLSLQFQLIVSFFHIKASLITFNICAFHLMCFSLLQVSFGKLKVRLWLMVYESGGSKLKMEGKKMKTI